MNNSSNRNGFVTWSQMVVTLLSIIAILAGGYAFIETWTWQAHSAQPHVGTIGTDAYIHDRQQLDNRLDRSFGRIDNTLGRLEVKIDLLVKEAKSP